MNGPPDWQDGECCFRCRTQFTLVARKHHCRNCGNIFCAKCSSQQIPLPKLNIEKNVRVCDTCYEKVVGKNDNMLALALGSNDMEQKHEQSTRQKTQVASKSSTVKSAANASAPSEQELKEEEELQLAMALSLSETPTKVSYPIYPHLEEQSKSMGPDKTVSSIPEDSAASSSNNTSEPKFTTNETSNSAAADSAKRASDPNPIQTCGYDFSALNSIATVPATLPPSSIAVTHPVQQQPQQQSVLQPPALQKNPSEFHIQDRDLELFKYIGEVHGLLEVFNNRLEACKLRNRPVANDAAIQSLFIKLNSEIQPKLDEYIKNYEDERGVFERVQDKLSQISDARAALDALREEHQEKMRHLAAEAEKQRQSQLASKLEAMRQKKTQMMQYQRELALQRIREQESIYQPQQHAAQQVAQNYQIPSNPAQLPYQQPLAEQQSYDHAVGHQQPTAAAISSVATLSNQDRAQQQWSAQPQVNQNSQYNQPYNPQVSAAYETQNLQQSSYATHQPKYNNYTSSHQQHSVSQSPVIDPAALAQLEKQFLPDAKPDEEAPLISFDD